ncbi:hypothetical protein HYS94_02005 [Candidatus Daviesbacteria bacterium]|nr:hypothetical protein [Candidatus Daviesbacteria bacterium]
MGNRELELLRMIASTDLERDDDRRLTMKDKRSLRRMYLNKLIMAEPVLWEEGQPYDKLMGLTEKGKLFIDG